MTDFAGLLRCLAESGVQYVVVRWAAATAHGSAPDAGLAVVYRRTDDTSGWRPPGRHTGRTCADRAPCRFAGRPAPSSEA
jgi:hypothetical protein